MFPVLDTFSDERQSENERVSILIPARNEAVNLPETLPRVLAQARGASRFIVLNDQSTDATGEILADSRGSSLLTSKV